MRVHVVTVIPKPRVRRPNVQGLIVHQIRKLLPFGIILMRCPPVTNLPNICTIHKFAMVNNVIIVLLEKFNLRWNSSIVWIVPRANFNPPPKPVGVRFVHLVGQLQQRVQRHV
jgi:hypothetical protein